MTSIFSKTTKALHSTNPEGEHSMSKDSMVFSVETITPAKAEKYLANCNGHNRPVRPRTVEKYAADMHDGFWTLTGAPIIFDSDGLILDGQHRLLAVIRSGREQPFAVVRGSDPKTFINIDNGAPRKVSDTTAYTQTEVATGRAMMRGARNNWLVPSNTRLAQFVAAHDEAVKWANGIMHMGGLKPVASVRGAIARAHGNVDPLRLEAFRQVLCTGRDVDGWATPGDSAANVLRDELTGVVQHRNRPGYSPKLTHLAPVHIYRMTEIAIDKFVWGHEVKKLRVPRVFVEAFPIPEDTDPSLSSH